MFKENLSVVIAVLGMLSALLFIILPVAIKLKEHKNRRELKAINSEYEEYLDKELPSLFESTRIVIPNKIGLGKSNNYGKAFGAVFTEHQEISLTSTIDIIDRMGDCK